MLAINKNCPARYPGKLGCGFNRVNRVAGGSNSWSQRGGVTTISFDTAFVAGFITSSCCYIAFRDKNSPFRCARPRSNRGRARFF